MNKILSWFYTTIVIYDSILFSTNVTDIRCYFSALIALNLHAVWRIQSFDADPDPIFHVDADPDPSLFSQGEN